MTTTVTVPEAAELLGVSADSLYGAFRNHGHIAAGPIRLHPIRCGNRLLVGRAAIDEFCAAIDNTPEPEPAPTPAPVEEEPARPKRRPAFGSMSDRQAPTGFRGARRSRGAEAGKLRRPTNPNGDGQ